MKIYQAVLFRTNGGDGEEAERKTLTQAIKALKKMIDGKPYHDAYIRCFDYYDDDINGGYITQDYNFYNFK